MMPFRLFRKKNISKTESDNFCSRMKFSPFSAVPPPITNKNQRRNMYVAI